MPMRAPPFIDFTAGAVIFFGVIVSSSRTEEDDGSCVLSAASCVLFQDAGRRTQDTGLRSFPSQSLLGSKRYVILRSLFRISNLLDELIEMLGCVHEVDLVGIHHQQRRLVVPVKVVRVRLAELLQILWRDRFFVSPPALLDALEECIKVSLQVDDQLRLRYRFVEQLV